MIASRSTTRSIVHTKYKYCTGKALAVASRARKLCQAAQQHQDNLISTNILEQCILAHFATDGLERTPEVVADAWGRAWTERLQELSDPVPLSFPDPYSNSHASCDVTLVGVFHRDAANLRVVRDAVSAAGGPDAVALEARPSFLPSYLHLAESLPEDLVMKMFDLPLHDLQAAFHYVDLEDRLAWHEVLLLTNEGLAHHQPGPPISTTPTISSGSSSSNSSSSSSSSSTSSSSSSTNISCKAQGSVAPFLAGAPSCPTTPSLSLSPSLSPTSALTAPKVVSAFLARELALSEKVAAALVAREYGIPLQGLELDDIEAYEGLLQGPLTDGQHRRTTALDSREPSTASTLQTASRGTDANGDGGGDGCRRNGSTKSRSSSAADGTVLSMPELEAEQWRMALDSLVPEVAAAFEEWLRSMAPDGEGSQQVGEGLRNG
ncbi:hypothetical protein Vafri_11801 [Volvox africanus]|uniref:Uncharacterized protein n=1 Tax=Volvox africanus TaxID=51714 RepID=A0A8J4B9N4_9CHLO|nr:hypothetical protein Vafri_11801 [Volvox africanus]